MGLDETYAILISAQTTTIGCHNWTKNLRLYAITVADPQNSSPGQFILSQAPEHLFLQSIDFSGVSSQI